MQDIKKNIFTLIATLGVFTLSVIPIPEEAPLSDVPFIDKWVHFVMYGGLTCAMWLDMFFIRKCRKISKGFCIAQLTFPVFMGGLMEIVQEYLTTYRNGDMLDFYADWFGAILGTILSLSVFLLLTKVAKK